MSTPTERRSRWYSLPLATRMVLQGLMFATIAVVYRYVSSFIWDVPQWDTSLVLLLAAVGALGAFFDDRGRRRIEHELAKVASQSD